MSVKVAVRVRPFNQREKDMEAVCCVTMNGPSTTIKNPDEDSHKERERTFAFDYSFWSHDQFENDENGYSHKTSEDSPYATQEMVYKALG